MNHTVDEGLYRDVARFGARDMEICMQCAVCSASCPLSSGTNTFPRKIYRYLQLGLRDKLLQAPEPWLCYYCGECNKDCPRGAEPAETMMAVRRWLTTQYDWTGLARRFYLSEKWEIGALGLLALGVVLLFVFFHGPVITDRVAVNTFAPVKWIEIGDLVMAAVLTAFLLSNAFRMYRGIMGGIRPPLSLYVTEAKTFVLHFLTQKRWRECGADRSRWLKHFILVTGYMTMMTLVIVFIRWFQVDDSSWHFTSLFGYYATGVLLFITVEIFRSRLRKQETIHRFSEPTDWLFLILLFLTTLTGIVMHGVRLAGWPMGTYVMYVIHLAVAVPMLVIEVPFGKWSHLFYRPLAVFLSTIKEKAARESRVDIREVIGGVGERFLNCISCGVCTGICPVTPTDGSGYNPRGIMRQLALDTATEQGLEKAVWQCLTCNACSVACPGGIDLTDVMRTVRGLDAGQQCMPECLLRPLAGLDRHGNPWGGQRTDRQQWASAQGIAPYAADAEYCLFVCCTTAHDPVAAKAGRALPLLLENAGVSFGTLGAAQNCCGDPAHAAGSADLAARMAGGNAALFREAGVRKLLTVSPHCHHAFAGNGAATDPSVESVHYTQLLDRLVTQNRFAPLGPVPRTVTYHDPCYLGRHAGIFDAPRRIIARIPGVRFVEMPNNRQASVCCGGGGGGAWRDARDGVRYAELRVREAVETGAQVIATACPFCIRMLDRAIRVCGEERRLAVMDVAELLWMSVVEAAAENRHRDKAMEPGDQQEAVHV